MKRLKLWFAVIFFPSLSLCCNFEIQNAILDSTCSEDIFEYSLHEYSRQFPPKIVFGDLSIYQIALLNGKEIASHTEYELFTRSGSHSEISQITFREKSGKTLSYTIQKTPNDFPRIATRGRSFPGKYFFSVFAPSRKISFAISLDHNGSLDYFRRFDELAVDFRPLDKNTYVIGLINRMVPNVTWTGRYVEWTPGSELKTLLEHENGLYTIYEKASLDLHDFVRIDQTTFLKIITYRDYDVNRGCLFHNDIVFSRNGVDQKVFSSRAFLSEIIKKKKPVYYWYDQSFCGEYFHINYLQLVDAQTLVISARFPSGILVFPLYSPQPYFWIGGLLGTDKKVFDPPWLFQHTPHYDVGQKRFVLFDNNKRENQSSIRVFNFDVSSKKLEGHQLFRPIQNSWSKTMGSSYFLDETRVLISSGEDILSNRSSIYEYDFVEKRSLFEIHLQESSFYIYRAYKIEKDW